MFKDDVKCVVAVTPTEGAAAATLITSAAVDTQGFRGCCFVVPMGAIVTNAVTSLKVQQSDDDAVTDDYTDITGTNQTIADNYDDKVKYVDIYHPGKLYLKLLISRATQNATVGGVIAYLYDPTHRPVTQPAAIAGESFNEAVEGTA